MPSRRDPAALAKARTVGGRRGPLGPDVGQRSPGDRRGARGPRRAARASRWPTTTLDRRARDRSEPEKHDPFGVLRKRPGVTVYSAGLVIGGGLRANVVFCRHSGSRNIRRHLQPSIGRICESDASERSPTSLVRGGSPTPRALGCRRHVIRCCRRRADIVAIDVLRNAATKRRGPRVQRHCAQGDRPSTA